MSVEQLAENVNALLTAIAANLPQGLDSVGSAKLHATKGSSFTVYRTPSTRMVTHSERKGRVKSPAFFSLFSLLPLVGRQRGWSVDQSVHCVWSPWLWRGSLDSYTH